MARGDGSHIKLLNKLAKIDVLVVDDWGLAPLSDAERRDFLEVIEDRHGMRSTIITSQYPVSLASRIAPPLPHFAVAHFQICCTSLSISKW